MREKIRSFSKYYKYLVGLFSSKQTVKLHDKDKPWVTRGYKKVIRNRQKAFYQGKSLLYRYLRNMQSK